MTYTDAAPTWPWTARTDQTDRLAEGGAEPSPPEPRVTPPLFMSDSLRARNGIPVFVEDWLRLERERDARRAAKASRDAPRNARGNGPGNA
ncbi:MAG: hypothetical protein AAFP13_08675 [Pseudomonadota bacterium]